MSESVPSALWYLFGVRQTPYQGVRIDIRLLLESQVPAYFPETVTEANLANLVCTRLANEVNGGDVSAAVLHR
jgi:hypothetical protein